jgi:hypothetical protein
MFRKFLTTAVFGGAVLVLLSTGSSARAAIIEYCSPSGSTTTDGSVSAEALFTTNNGSITLTLSNLFQNPNADGQLISAISFDVSGASGSGSLTTVNSGLIGTISPAGSYTAAGSDLLTRWKASESGTTINLTTLSGGKPNRLLIGPDSAGGFTMAGLYDNANPSILQHNLSVLGSATFDITIPGVTDTSTLSDVVFQFGTEAGRNLVPGEPRGPGTPPLPEPSTLLVWTGLGVLGLVMARRRHQRAA